MAPRWVKTREHTPGLFAPNIDPDDCQLLSGGFVLWGLSRNVLLGQSNTGFDPTRTSCHVRSTSALRW
jgi:hypothetical protein